MDQIEWCCRQKSGIRIIEPNENIAEDYFKKAEDSLSVVQTISVLDWKIISSYYACYDCLYALLQKAGIKCEIHECSIALMRFFDFSKKELEFIKNLKDKRIDAQYYTKKLSVVDESKVKDFVLRCKEISHKADFKSIRNKIIEEINKYKDNL